MSSSIPIIDNFLMLHDNIQRYGCESPRFLQFILTGNFVWSKEQENEHNTFSRDLGVSYDKALHYKWILSCWESDLEFSKNRVSKLVTDPSLLEHDIFYISDCLFLWSKNLIIEPLLDELAKLVLVNQIVSDVCFTLNHRHLLAVKNKKAAHAPKKKDDVYFTTLMIYLEAGDKSKAAKKLGVERKTISNHLKKVVGEYSSNLQDHPQLAKIKKAYDIWKSIKQ